MHYSAEDSCGFPKTIVYLILYLERVRSYSRPLENVVVLFGSSHQAYFREDGKTRAEQQTDKLTHSLV